MHISILSHEWPPVTGGAGKALEGFVRVSLPFCDEYDVHRHPAWASEEERTKHRLEEYHHFYGSRGHK